MNKNQKIFLIIGLIVLAATTIIISINQYNETLQSYINTIHLYTVAEFWYWEILNIIFEKFNIILFEISIVVNIYGFLNTEQLKYKRVLFGVNSIISFLSVVMLLLVTNLHFDYKFAATTLLLLGPINIATLILGSVLIKKKKPLRNS